MNGVGSVAVFLLVYLLGGVTFVPLLVGAFWFLGTVDANHTATTEESSRRDDHEVQSDPKSLNKEERKERISVGTGITDVVLQELKARRHIPDVAAGYFAVCREYVPGGINGKPPERTTPAGAVIAMESPSVYQSMYRSIFDRKKTLSPSIDGIHGKNKKARNVFYVVLRHGHLMLYDDSEQLEVRHVISLAHYDMDVYAGGEPIPEGELWIRRNCIRLTQQTQPDRIGDAKPFYLFSDNCSEKEDFYHAMLQSQEFHGDSSAGQPLPLRFNTSDLVRLVQQLHASEENLHTRWVNALIGRLFLAVYKTPKIERFIWTKITKKIARVPKPALISGIRVERIDMGQLPPFITDPKLKELTVDGDLIIEADVSYKGNFRLEISAIARIDLGSRFKAREVTLILASVLKRLEGHILIRIKPPPSNRIWITFETAPEMDLSLEPIVSSRQITYGVILRAIESRIREVVSETLVFPNWDDIPFYDTTLQQFRGGIWETSEEELESRAEPVREDATLDEDLEPDLGLQPDTINMPSNEGTKGMPELGSIDAVKIRSVMLSSLDLPEERMCVSSATEPKPTGKPRAMRSGSFASIASPIVKVDPANASVSKFEERKFQHDAATAMKTTMSRSPPPSPFETPIGSPSERGATSPGGQPSSFETEVDTTSLSRENIPGTVPGLNDTVPSAGQASTILPSEHQPSQLSALASIQHLGKHPNINKSLNSASAVAKKWLASRQLPGSPSSPKPRSSPLQAPSENDPLKASPGISATNTHLGPSSASSSMFNLSADTVHQLGPIGRGHPLPPPGTPLPTPPKRSPWSVPAASAFTNLARRKPLPIRQSFPSHMEDASDHSQTSTTPPDVPHYSETDRSRRVPRRKSSTTSSKSSTASALPPPLPKRPDRPSASDRANSSSGNEESLLIVEAPNQENSAPASPVDLRPADEQATVFQDMELDDGHA